MEPKCGVAIIIRVAGSCYCAPPDGGQRVETIMAKNTSTKFFAIVLSLSVAGGLTLSVPDAEAKKGRDVQEQSYDFKEPHDGFEGFDNTGGYCSYRKVPKRVCTVRKNGKRVCKVKGWTLTQICQ